MDSSLGRLHLSMQLLLNSFFQVLLFYKLFLPENRCSFLYRLIKSCNYLRLCFNPCDGTSTSKMRNYWGAAMFVSNFHSLQKTLKT